MSHLCVIETVVDVLIICHLAVQRQKRHTRKDDYVDSKDGQLIINVWKSNEIQYGISSSGESDHSNIIQVRA